MDKGSPYAVQTVSRPESRAEQDGEEQEDYGCLAFKPRCLQRFNKIQCHVICACVLAFFEGFVVNGVINVALVALEQRYSLSSARSALIASGNDIGAVMVVVFAGYFGEQRHKPRLVGTGAVIMALGCLLFALPHFTGGEYQYTISRDSDDNGTNNICRPDTNVTSLCDVSSSSEVRDNTLYYVMLMIGNGLLGVGASPLLTIGVSYIDENCKPKLTSLYISFMYCSAAVGVAVGYVVGGQTLSLFVDVDKVDINTVPLTPSDPQWVGAWWIGALVGLVGFVLIAVPMYGYPRRLPGYTELQKSRVSEAHGGNEEVTAQANFGKSWRDFPKSIWMLVRNTTYLFICLGSAVEALAIGGMATFGAKLIQEKFNIDISLAGTIMGIITIPGSGGGMLLGGYLVKRFKLRCRGIIRMCAAFMLTALCFGPFMLARCTNDPIAGLDVPYLTEKFSNGLDSACNNQCGCSTLAFEPLCVDNTVYFTPCHAGCKGLLHDTGNMTDYAACSCIMNGTPLDPGTGIRTGLCSGRCLWLYVFCVLFGLVMVLTFATISPGVTAVFRCVSDKQRSVAIGVNLLFIRVAGTIPGPILLGAIIDSTCSIWQQSCDDTGACWVYDKQTMGARLVLWFMCLKFSGFVCFLIASIVYKQPQSPMNYAEDAVDNSIENEHKDRKSGSPKTGCYNPTFSTL